MRTTPRSGIGPEAKAVTGKIGSPGLAIVIFWAFRRLVRVAFLVGGWRECGFVRIVDEAQAWPCAG